MSKPPTFSAQSIQALFPLPSSPPSVTTPFRAGAVTHESSETVVKTLKDNHQRFHIYFNDRGFHNHASHHLLAIYALGAPGALIDAAYETHVRYQRPAFESPGVVTEENFNEHLGNELYYNAYLRFFSDILEKDGSDIGAVLEKFIFSDKFNFNSNLGEGKQQPEMLNRFLAGLLHPMIHTGYGCEFGLKGIVAEGLAQMSIHKTTASSLLRQDFFESMPKFSSTDSSSGVSRLTNILPKLSLRSNAQQAPSQAGKGGKHLFSILAKMIKDPRLDPATLKLAQEESKIERAFDLGSDVVREYADQWDVSAVGQDPVELEGKLEELFWSQVLIYGVGGWNKEKGLRADFFLMHLVTSALMLPSILAYLKPSSQQALLRSYLRYSLIWWVGRGRPGFEIKQFYESTSPLPTPHGSAPKPAKDTLAPNGLTDPNPWLPIIQTTIMHPNEHLCKLQRSLVHAAEVYGTRPKGYFAPIGAGEPSLDGLDVLDGTLFVRVAGLTADHLGWMREGEEGRSWYRDGFFE